MKAAESSLVRRLDEVRPHGKVRHLKEIDLPELPSRHTPAPKPDPKPIKPKPSAKAFSVGQLLDFGKWSVFLLAVVLPTVIGGLYYAFIASPQYVSEFRFSVRPNMGASSSSSAAVDAALVMSNSYIVSDYVTSLDAVVALENAVGLRKLYSQEGTDFLNRFREDASIEDLVKYWNSRIKTSYDITTGINVVEVSAFSPDAAQTIAATLKELCERLINQISDGARKSQMEFARDELDRAEVRLKEVRHEETVMRTDQRTIDARKEADGRIQLNLKLQSELATLQSQYNSLVPHMDPKSPRLIVLKNQISATKEQIAQMQAQVGSEGEATSGASALSAIAITRYDQLQTELEIASKLYESALNNYEKARAQANSNQIYLATYVQPNVPQTAAYPRIFFDTFLIFLSACGVWIVMTLIYYSIRDHV